MKHLKLVLILSLLSLLSLSSLAFAITITNEVQPAEPTVDEMSQDNGSKGIPMAKNMLMLGSATVDGVKAMAHISDLHEGTAKAGTKATRHLMVAFEDETNGGIISEGSVAVKIISPDGSVGSSMSMTGRQGVFVIGLKLTEPGTYGFLVGTKLLDGKVRQYRFNYELK